MSATETGETQPIDEAEAILRVWPTIHSILDAFFD